ICGASSRISRSSKSCVRSCWLRGGKPKSADDKSAVIIPDGPVLKMGTQHEQVALLRKRLDVRANSQAEENTFDAALVEAVERFQDAHGVLPDGLVGPGMRRLLNGRQIARRRLGSSVVAVGTPRCSSVTICASNISAGMSIPAPSTGTRWTS